MYFYIACSNFDLFVFYISIAFFIYHLIYNQIVFQQVLQFEGLDKKFICFYKDPLIK
jgi:hypothetical protein